MHNSFISIVTVIDNLESTKLLKEHLTNLYGILSSSFSDYEIILVNNIHLRDYSGIIDDLPADLKQHIFMLNLSSPVNRNHAIVAGLDRSNGDYTVIFDIKFYKKCELVEQLYLKSSAGSDIVYLKARKRQLKMRYTLFYKIFYWILKTYSDLQVDEKAHDSRIISRRALNSLLRLRENLRYMKAIYSIIGFSTDFIEVAEPLSEDQYNFGDKFRTSLVAISSFTNFLRSLLLWIFLVSLLFMGIVIINAIKVKLTNIDLLGTYHEALPGWTFLVVLTSMFFAITCLMLYIMSIYLANIYQEIKHRPMYILESVKRFS